MEHVMCCEMVFQFLLFEDGSTFKMAGVFTNSFKYDQHAVIQFWSVEGCKPVEIHQRMIATYGKSNKESCYGLVVNVPLRPWENDWFGTTSQANKVFN